MTGVIKTIFLILIPSLITELQLAESEWASFCDNFNDVAIDVNASLTKSIVCQVLNSCVLDTSC